MNTKVRLPFMKKDGILFTDKFLYKKGVNMEIMNIEELSDLDIRDLINESIYPLDGFIISEDDFSSIRVIARQHITKEQVSLEEAIKSAFFGRMKFTGRLDKVLSWISDDERKELCLDTSGCECSSCHCEKPLRSL